MPHRRLLSWSDFYLALYVAAIPPDTETECPICREEYNINGHHAVMFIDRYRCNHVFGAACLDTWLSTTGSPRTCPICRRALGLYEIERARETIEREREWERLERLERERLERARLEWERRERERLERERLEWERRERERVERERLEREGREKKRLEREAEEEEDRRVEEMLDECIAHVHARSREDRTDETREQQEEEIDVNDDGNNNINEDQNDDEWEANTTPFAQPSAGENEDSSSSSSSSSYDTEEEEDNPHYCYRCMHEITHDGDSPRCECGDDAQLEPSPGSG